MNAQQIIKQLKKIAESLEDDHAFDSDEIDKIEDLLEEIEDLLY